MDGRIRHDRLRLRREAEARPKDGSGFVGEEFGPYLLHFDAQGTLMSGSVARPFPKIPPNPLVMNNGAQVTSQGSVAFNSTRTRLSAVPGAAPTVAALCPVASDERYLNFFEFDPAAVMACTGHNLVYKKDGPHSGNQIVTGDMTNVAGKKFVLIGRDSKVGPTLVAGAAARSEAAAPVCCSRRD